MIKAIIYDADGMVVIPPKMFSEYFCDLQHLSPDLVIPFFTHEFKDCLRGQRDLKTALKPYLLKWRWTKSIDDLLKLWFDYENCLNQPLLDSLHTLRQPSLICVLATNQEKYRLEYLRQQIHLADYFHHLYCSCEIGHLKPTSEFFDFVIKDLNLPKNEIMFWDDRLSYVQAAQEYGFISHQYRSFDQYQQIIKTFM